MEVQTLESWPSNQAFFCWDWLVGSFNKLFKRPALPRLKMISVIVPCYNSKETIHLLLSALEQQDYEDFETIVVDSSSDGTDRVISESYPWVKLIHFENKTLPGRARNIGMSMARGDIYAFIDADCRPPSDWLQNIESLHRKYDVFGGIVLNGNPTKLIGWASFMSEFSEIYSLRPRITTLLPTCNLSVKKKVVGSVVFPEDMFPGEDRIFAVNLSKNCYTFLHPQLKVYHNNRASFSSFFRHQVRLGYSSAQVRQRASASDLFGSQLIHKPWLLVFLPFYRCYVIGLRCLNRGGVDFFMYLFLFPLFIVGMLWWNYGFIKCLKGADL